MAGKRTGKASKADFGSYVFVKCELRAEDKAEAKAWLEKNYKQFATQVHDVCTDGYKFSVSFSPDHETYTATLTGKEDNPINGKKMLTARHKDWVVASQTVLYKHLVMFGGEVWEDAAQDEDGGWS